MDVRKRKRKRMDPGLPLSVTKLEAGGPREVAELWQLARGYSRLRHRTAFGRERRRLETLKDHCVRAALAREPDLFFVFVDPGMPHFWVIYHRVERTLLHFPVTTDLRQFAGRGDDSAAVAASEGAR